MNCNNRSYKRFIFSVYFSLELISTVNIIIASFICIKCCIYLSNYKYISMKKTAHRMYDA